MSMQQAHVTATSLLPQVKGSKSNTHPDTPLEDLPLNNHDKSSDVVAAESQLGVQPEGQPELHRKSHRKSSLFTLQKVHWH
jgi:hypothetical protein